MPLIRKRRAPVEEASEDEGTPVSEARTQQQSRLESPGSEADDYADGDQEGEVSSGSVEQLAKKLVRLALACEYARASIKRQDINTKVLGTRSKLFKPVFDEAQLQLKYVFGMEMTELPGREKVTIQQKRAAQKSESTSKSSNSWVLTSTLPAKYRDPAIITPPRVPTAATESAYIGLYTFITSIIYLAGGSLPEAKLDRYLKRTNADQSTPVDKTDKLLARMVREGYIVKVKERNDGEETVDYVVGPRGKVEVGEDGVAGLVRSVYGENAAEDLEKRIERSLGLGERRAAGPTAGASTQNGTKRGAGRQRRQPAEDGQQVEEDDSDEEEEE